VALAVVEATLARVGGFHLDQHNQPYSKVITAVNDDGYVIDVQ
jgi:hypothetical protein